jgi:hypothetical protein
MGHVLTAKINIPLNGARHDGKKRHGAIRCALNRASPTFGHNEDRENQQQGAARREDG